MVNRSHNDQVSIRDIEYYIRIKDKGFHELRKLLIQELTRFSGNPRQTDRFRNPILEFLKTNIERSIAAQFNTRVYLINYFEQGSFSIQFNLLVISPPDNFEKTRHSLDILIRETIGDYFKEILERHIPVILTVNVNESILYDIPNNLPDETMKRSTYRRDYVSAIFSFIAISISLGIFMVWILRASLLPKSDPKQSDYTPAKLELIIDEQLKKVIQEGQFRTQKQGTDENPPDTAVEKQPL